MKTIERRYEQILKCDQRSMERIIARGVITEEGIYNYGNKILRHLCQFNKDYNRDSRFDQFMYSLRDKLNEMGDNVVREFERRGGILTPLGVSK